MSYCRKDWCKRTRQAWSDEHTRDLRAELDRDLDSIREAQRRLVGAFQGAIRVVNDLPAGDPRTAPLQEFLETLSDKTVTWIGHFSDAGRGLDGTPPDGRTRLVLYEMNAGRGDDAGLLARLSLLLGYFPRSATPETPVAIVVDLERKAMVQAMKRAKKWLNDRKMRRARARDV